MQRLRSIPPVPAAVALAAFVLLEGAAEYLFTTDAAGGDLAVALGCSALTALGVLVARWYPFTGVATAMLGLLATNALPKEITEGVGGAWLVVIFLVFWMSMRTEGRALALRLIVTYLLMVAQSVTDQYPFNPFDYVFAAVILVGGPAAVGQLLRSRAKLAQALREKAEQSDRARERDAVEAVVAERERIAGELHDVVAHALGAMTVQASAARRLTAHDPARAIDAFHAVEDTGRAAMTELRRLLGVLRREDEDLALAPQPRLAYLADLARRSTAIGLPAGLSVEGTAPGSIPAGIDLTGYRVVQEALRDAMSAGAAGRAEVKLRYDGDAVEIEVRDDGRGEARSLLGMEERVRVYGGQLRSEHGENGHRVVARLPLEAAG